MSDVKQKILDAIELLATNSIQKAGYDRTIQAQILSCADAAIGKYKCKYQDSIFYAYVTNPDIALSKGTSVYILVPENDMRKNKTIIGTVDKLGVDYVSSAIGEQAYHIIGTNCITSSNVMTYLLDVDKKDYSFNIFQAGNVGVDEDALQKYLKQSSSLIIGATIKTTIPPEKQFEGHYGITYGLSFINPEDNTIVIRDYTIDEDNMIDNPYRLAYPTRQYAIFDIDGANFNRLEYITLFCKDFINAVDDPPEPLTYEIELSKLELTGTVKMSEEQLNGSVINFYTPRGTFFQTGATNNDYKTITAQVKIKGRLVSSSENIEFYWGRQDVSVVSDSQYYNRYLGRGWKCLNSYNSIDLNTTPPSIQWIPYQDTYIFNYQQVTARNNKIKVAAVYDGSVLTKQINIEDFNKDTNFIQIVSEFGKNFYYGVGKTNLTCRVNPPQGTTYNNLSYYWAWQNYGGVWETLDSTSDFVTNVTTEIEEISGKLVGCVKELQIHKIFNFATFKCTVYNNNALLGTASIILTNSTQGQGFNSLIINNGTVVFKYNADGISPTIEGKTLTEKQENPQIIQSLSFTLYDESGEAISSTEINNPYLCTIKWGIPRKNTMIVDKGNGDPIVTPSEGDKYVYYKNYILNYDICSAYDASKVENQIILSVTYKGIVYTAETNFTFVKEGYAGTNGTDYMVKLVPNTLLSNPPEFPIITKINGGDIKINYGVNSAEEESTLSSNQQLLKAQLWYKGQIVWQGFSTSNTGTITPSEVKWSVLANKYNSSVSDASDFVINNVDNGSMTYTYSNSSDPKANIIKCAITYNNKVYYGTLPIMTAYVSDGDYRVKLKENSGFRYVLYAADGTNPEYSTAYPFEFLIEGVPQGTNVSYVTSTVGNVKSTTSNLTTSVDLLIPLNSEYYRSGLASNQFKYKPVPRYDGLCVNAAIDCLYKDPSNNTIAKLRVPVHFILNKYGLSNLNAWDGNSIQIDNQGGYILAPQVGAGKKETDNSFTGVLMGQVHNAGKSGADIGLLGYNSGSRTFFLNSENGSAIFGNKITSQIIIDPASDNARLYSGDFWKATNYNAQTGLPNSYLQSQYNDAGMLIDLTTPKIIFKNRMFEIDQNGSIKANRIPQYQTGHQGQVGYQKRDTDGYIIYENLWNFNVNAQTGLIQSGYDTNNRQYNFTVDGATGNVTLTGTVTANAGKIGGSNGWTIGGDNSIGYFFSGLRNTISGYYNQETHILYPNVKGIYIGTNGISIGDGNKVTFSVDSNGNVTINGDISLSKDSVISFGNDGDYTIGQLTQDLQNLVDGVGGSSLNYIKGTFINGTTIKSPNIYGGAFYATGLRGTNPSYYISPGFDNSGNPRTPVGYIAYDDQGSGSSQENEYRVIMETVSNVVLKLRAAADLSLTAGVYSNNMNNHNPWYNIYLDSFIRMGESFSLGVDAYGYDDPQDVFTAARGYDGIINYVRSGQVYFKLD